MHKDYQRGEEGVELYKGTFIKIRQKEKKGIAACSWTGAVEHVREDAAERAPDDNWAGG